MSYDKYRMEKLYNKVHSTKPRSPERNAVVDELSEEDLAGLCDYDLDILSGKVKRPNYDQEVDGMNYEEFKTKTKTGGAKKMLELSEFAKRNLALYQKYRQRYYEEEDEKMRLHNKKVMGW